MLWFTPKSQQKLSVAQALLIQRWRTPVLLAFGAVTLTLLSLADHWLLPTPATPSAKYKITGWSNEGCFLAVPVGMTGPTKRLYPLHMTHPGNLSEAPPSWLLNEEINVHRVWLPDQSPDIIIAKGFTGASEPGDLMARLIISGWLVPLPNQTLDDRERAFIQQHRWNQRTREVKNTRRKD